MFFFVMKTSSDFYACGFHRKMCLFAVQSPHSLPPPLNANATGVCSDIS